MRTEPLGTGGGDDAVVPLTDAPAEVRDAAAPGGPDRADPRAFLLVVLGAVLWGTGGLAGAALTDAGLTPGAVAAVRLGAGGLALSVVLLVARALPHPLAVLRDRRALVRVLVVAALLAAYQACYFTAISLSSVSIATLVALGAAPVLVAVATSVGARRLPDVRVVGAIALAVAGLLLLVAPGLRDDGSGVVGGPAGPLLALLAAATFAGVTLVNRRPVPGLDPVVMTAVSFVLGGLVLLPWALVAGLPGVSRGPGEAVDAGRVVLLVAFLALVPTAAAWAAYFTGLHGVPATTASLVALLEPLTAAVGAAVVRGERIGALGVVGGVALAAATLAVRPRRRRGA
ncbi:DMT family transporter [Actinotalea solisilvae]|uniref:DMT family transporter n=1 Tax=Actinotalea solisilvae TaxID=2072922 RepID=UPI0018F1A75A|nr:DMT family transporter [Actinotalea solisilvae]